MARSGTDTGGGVAHTRRFTRSGVTGDTGRQLDSPAPPSYPSRYVGKQMKPLLVLGALAFAMSAGCGGGNSKSSDAAVFDAATADAPPSGDASVAEACQNLCDCAETYCSEDKTHCLDECAQMPASVRACRITHCGYAQTNPTFHCPHVAGDPNGPGTPQACIWPEGADAGVDAGGNAGLDAMAADAN